MLGWLTRWPVTGVIVLYRRWLSGRGPLRRVCCSFHGSESCSAYGLRRARHPTGALSAILDIARRLRRCRRVALYRHDRALAWGPDLDQSADTLEANLRASKETPTTIAMVLRAKAAVADYRGDTQLAVQCAARARALSPAPSSLVVRGPRAAARRDGRIRNLLAARHFDGP